MNEIPPSTRAKEGLFRYLRQEIGDDRVVSAMERVPREYFVPPTSQHLAYEDMPLAIGEDQTISQPFIVAMMTSALELKGEEQVLEIGTGSGYQAAILCKLARWVVTVERFSNLAESARRILKKLGYNNAEVHIAGDTIGWKEAAPYDAIIVTAGAPQVPQELIGQLVAGGRLVIPVGSRFEEQLIKAKKEKTGITTESLGACRFVPLRGKGAWGYE